MIWELGTYASVLLAAGIICLGSAAFSWSRRRAPGGSVLTALTLVVAWWCFCGALEASSEAFAAKILAAKFQYISIASIAVLWLTFALARSRRLAALPPRLIAGLWLFPVILVVLAFSNERHGLVWASIRPASDQLGAPLIYDHGPAVWIGLVFSYALVLQATVLLARDAIRMSGILRKQAVWLLAGAAFPWLGNIAYMFHWGPAGFDGTPVAFALAGACLAVSLLRYRLLDVVPIARDQLLAGLADSVLVLDPAHRILDLNPAARRLLGVSADYVGGSLLDLLAPWPEFAGLVAGPLGHEESQVVRCPDGGRWLDVRISRLNDSGGRLSGRLIVLHDITPLKAAEEERVTALERVGRQQQAVLALAIHPAVTAGDLPAAAAALTEAAGATMDVERTSLWIGSLEEGGIRCLDLFERSRARHSSGTILPAERDSAYFAAVAAGRVIDADDAASDPRTSEFLEGYLRPLGIGSLLDAPIRAGGRVRGIVCFERVGPARAWRPDEIRFAGEIADQAAQALVNAERRRGEETLRASLREKEVLLKEVHHRVRNNMQVVSSLLNLQARSAPDPALQRMVEESRRRIKAMALVHERLYKSPDLARIDFAGYARDLAVHVFQVLQADARRIRFESRLEPLSLDVGLSIPLGLVLNELISNALQHGYPAGRTGAVTVGLEPFGPGRARLWVSDDGVGWAGPEEPGAGGSLGLQIIRTLADQIGGKLVFRSAGGTVAEVIFPLLEAAPTS